MSDILFHYIHDEDVHYNCVTGASQEKHPIRNSVSHVWSIPSHLDTLGSLLLMSQYTNNMCYEHKHQWVTLENTTPYGEVSLVIGQFRSILKHLVSAYKGCYTDTLGLGHVVPYISNADVWNQVWCCGQQRLVEICYSTFFVLKSWKKKKNKKCDAKFSKHLGFF